MALPIDGWTDTEKQAWLKLLGQMNDQLLEDTARDYIFLTRDTGSRKFAWVRDRCEEECERRGKPDLFEAAEASS